MLELQGVRIGFAICGSFCCAERAIHAAEDCLKAGATLLPIVSEPFATTQTRFGAPSVFLETLTAYGNGKLIRSIVDAEPIGPKNLTDVLVVTPCTGNVLGKLANGITDNTVTMAVKSHLRGGKPVVLAIATNDGLAASARNLGDLLNRRHYYFVPFGQDQPQTKPTSLVADFMKLPETIALALEHKQIQPILHSYE